MITLDDPARRNAVTIAMRNELIAAFDEFETSDEVLAVVLTGAGSSFCSGADLGDLAAASSADLRAIYDAFLRITTSPLPSIAAVNGPAVGAGLNLVLACDLRLAARRARFMTGFLRIGLHPGGGSTWMLRQAVGPELTAAMMLFGHELDGEAAHRVGLVLGCVDDDRLIDEACAIARRAASAPPPLVARAKQTLRAMASIRDLDGAVAYELEAQAWSSQQHFFRERIGRAGARPDPMRTGEQA
jgi:enoyl-CoA hydratase